MEAGVLACSALVRSLHRDGFRSEDASLRTLVDVIRREWQALDDASEKRRGGEQRVEIILARKCRCLLRNRHAATMDPRGGPQS